MGYCERCKLPLWNDSSTTANVQICICPPISPIPNSGMIGWVCPNCKAGISPFIDKCTCNITDQFKITCKGDTV